MNIIKTLPNHACKLTIILTLLTMLGVHAEDASTWKQEGEAALIAAKRITPNTKRAKNIILFLGDGMGISTITASRIFEGQQKGLDGERNQLSFESLPYVALSKTYSANQQTPDSAPTMTAIVTGVKTNDGELSVNQSVKRFEENNEVIKANQVATILEQAEQSGRATGVVTTTRITHATPAATYAHISNRDWEDDSELPNGTHIQDIAAQLIDHFGKNGIGDGIEVMMGGGRSNFMPETKIDPEYPTIKGRRKDGRDLIAEYQDKFGANYVWNQAQFDAIKAADTKKLLGLFEPSHMQYENNRLKDIAGEPSLMEMTAKALDILKNNKIGYLLVVEGGRIDHASHAGNAFRTLNETTAFANAIKKTLEKVSLDDTLVIVTADHSHTLTIGGYPKRGNPILGKVIQAGESEYKKAADQKPFTTLSFANGSKAFESSRAGRKEDLTQVNTEDPDYHQEFNIPLNGDETHGGEDVAIFAGGPNAYLFHGVQEQSYIYYVMKDAFGF